MIAADHDTDERKHEADAPPSPEVYRRMATTRTGCRGLTLASAGRATINYAWKTVSSSKGVSTMRFLVIILVLAVVCPTAAVGEDAGLAFPEIRGVTRETRTYKRVGRVNLDMTICYPPGHAATDKRAAIVFFFGGGWTGGTPTQFKRDDWHCRGMRRNGGGRDGQQQFGRRARSPHGILMQWV